MHVDLKQEAMSSVTAQYTRQRYGENKTCISQVGICQNGNLIFPEHSSLLLENPVIIKEWGEKIECQWHVEIYLWPLKIKCFCSEDSPHLHLSQKGKFSSQVHAIYSCNAKQEAFQLPSKSLANPCGFSLKIIQYLTNSQHLTAIPLLQAITSSPP